MHPIDTLKTRSIADMGSSDDDGCPKHYTLNPDLSIAEKGSSDDDSLSR